MYNEGHWYNQSSWSFKCKSGHVMLHTIYCDFSPSRQHAMCGNHYKILHMQYILLPHTLTTVKEGTLHNQHVLGRKMKELLKEYNQSTMH
jgi:hypothetical protein